MGDWDRIAYRDGFVLQDPLTGMYYGQDGSNVGDIEEAFWFTNEEAIWRHFQEKATAETPD